MLHPQNCVHSLRYIINRVLVCNDIWTDGRRLYACNTPSNIIGVCILPYVLKNSTIGVPYTLLHMPYRRFIFIIITYLLYCYGQGSRDLLGFAVFPLLPPHTTGRGKEVVQDSVVTITGFPGILCKISTNDILLSYSSFHPFLGISGFTFRCCWSFCGMPLLNSVTKFLNDIVHHEFLKNFHYFVSVDRKFALWFLCGKNLINISLAVGWDFGISIVQVH